MGGSWCLVNTQTPLAGQWVGTCDNQANLGWGSLAETRGGSELDITPKSGNTQLPCPGDIPSPSC